MKTWWKQNDRSSSRAGSTMTDQLPESDVSEPDLAIDVALVPELEDAELGSVVEALLLVVDTPVTVEALAAATEQPVHRIAAKLRAIFEDLARREDGAGPALRPAT